MNDTDFQKRVLVLCEEALTHEPDDRRAFLDGACDNDTEMRIAVEKLMATVEQTSDFLRPATEELNYEAGDMVGEYRIVRNLGRGGMGSVYLAEREAAGYSQRVALKVMRTHLQSTDMINRFDEERRILARLHHPYIARLMDGGTTEQGLPYLVTELVEGVPIDTFCDEQRLTVKERLKLVQKVALGIQSAHQNLVVHSDLKPGNILITEDGIPKLLDFGIAKLVRPVSANDPQETMTIDLLALTPDYASPEQIAGDVVTTTSDVYSLAVLTYRLLVGETPYVIKAAPRADMIEALENTSIPLASRHVLALRKMAFVETIADNRQTTSAKLSRQLSGDLDTVLLKALDSDPQQRYSSALMYANELKHFCDGMPISAGGDAAAYKIRKFIGRHRFSVAAGCAALLALVGGLGISIWQAHIAERRFDDLQGFAETVMFDLHDEIADLPGGTSARQLMTRESLHYLDRLAKDAGGDRALQLDLSRAYKRLGDVLGNPTNANLGDVESAVDSYEKALAIAEDLSTGFKYDAKIVRQKALVHEKIADVLTWKGKLDDALTHSLQSREIFESLATRFPDDHQHVMSVAISRVKLGDMLGHPSFPNAGKKAEALEEYQEALAAITPLSDASDSPMRTRRYLALIHERVGTMLSEVNQFDDALIHFETSLTVREQLAALQPANANSRRDVAIAHEKIGDLSLARGDAQNAIRLYEQALVMYRALAKSDPDNTNAVRTLAIGLENLAEALLVAGDTQAARGYFSEIIDIREALVERNPDNERLTSELEQIVVRANSL